MWQNSLRSFLWPGVKSFLLNVAGFTCVTFTTGALAFYGPNYVKLVSLIGLKPGGESFFKEGKSLY